MKKLLVVLLILSAIFVGNVVFADAAPNFKPYKVEVINPEGTLLYEYDSYDNSGEWVSVKKETGKILNVGETAETFYISINDDNEYVSVWGKDFNGFVLKRDIRIIKDDLSLADYNLDEDVPTTTFKVVNINGVKLYEWPGEEYDVIGAIPYNTTFEGYYSRASEEWYYVQYEGINGWINYHDTGIICKIDSKVIIPWYGATLVNENGKELQKLPPNTVFDDVWVQHYGGERGGIAKVYLSYNNNSGFVSTDQIALTSDYDNTYKVNYEGAIFIGVDNEIVDLPQNTTLNYDYCTYRDDFVEDYWILTNYNNVKGWVYGSYSDNMNILYSNILLNKLGKEGPYTIEDVKEYLAIVKTEVEAMRTNISGDEIISGEENANNESTIIDNEINIDETQVSSDNKKIFSEQIILICILFAAIVSVTALVIILYMIKNKKN